MPSRAEGSVLIAYTQKKYNSREATHNTPRNKEVILVRIPQVGHILVRQYRIIAPNVGSPILEFPVQSS